MAQGASANLTGILADAFPQVLNSTAIPIVAKNRPFLHMILGKPVPPQGIDPSMMDKQPNLPNFERLTRLDGNQVELRLLGTVDEPQFVGMTTAEQFTPVAPNYTEKRFSAKFNIAQVVYVYDVPMVKLKQVAGDAAKCGSFLKEEAVATANGIEQFLARAVNSNGDATDKTVTGWRLPLGGATGSYLNIDLSDAGNVDFVAQQHNVNGTMNFKHIMNAQSLSWNAGGDVDFAVCNITDYQGIAQIVEGKFVPTTNDQQWRQFGGRYLQVRGTQYLLDNYHATSGTIAYMDSRQIAAWMGIDGFTAQGMSRNNQVLSGNRMFIDMWFQWIMKNNQFNVRQYGITAFA